MYWPKPTEKEGFSVMDMIFPNVVLRRNSTSSGSIALIMDSVLLGLWYVLIVSPAGSSPATNVRSVISKSPILANSHFLDLYEYENGTFFGWMKRDFYLRNVKREWFFLKKCKKRMIFVEEKWVLKLCKWRPLVFSRSFKQDITLVIILCVKGCYLLGSDIKSDITRYHNCVGM